MAHIAPSSKERCLVRFHVNLGECTWTLVVAYNPAIGFRGLLKW